MRYIIDETGPLEKRISRLRESLLHVQAVLDTAVDFSEEYAAAYSGARKPVSEAIHECSLVTQAYEQFKKLTSHRRVALVGRPNAGKSSLFNAFLARQRTIVSDIPGTTRDAVEDDFWLDGSPWRLVDTAGSRDASEALERKGIEVGQDYLRASSLWVLVIDGCAGLSDVEREIIAGWKEKPFLIAWNKQDLADWKEPSSEIPFPTVPVSTKTGFGVPECLASLEKLAKEIPRPEGVVPTAGQATRLGQIVKELENLEKTLKTEGPPEYAAEINRRVIGQLDGVVGEVESEEVLGKIFSSFCIGK